MKRAQSMTGRRSATQAQLNPHAAPAMSGFTLLELMVTLVIMSVFAGMAAPSLGALVQNNRLEAEQMEFLAALNTARSEAVKRGVPVMVSATAPGVSGNEYGGGWSIWFDANNDGVFQPATETIKIKQALTGDLKVSSGVSQMTFLPSGFSGYRNNNGQMAAATFTICDSRSNVTGGQITVLPSGSPNLNAKYTCS